MSPLISRAALLCLLMTWSSLAIASEGTGLQGTYFANETLSGTPALTRVDAQVNFAWSGGAPGTGLPVDNFSVRWDGEIVPLYSETLTLIARTDDGVRLWLDGQLVIDAWVLRGAADSTYTFTAVAGQRYRIRMEYYEHFGSAVAQLQWRSATIARTAVPRSQLFPTAPVEPPAGTGSGLLARYYANETLSGTPVLARTDARVDFGWGGGSPGAGVPVDSFSARWDGEIEARVSEPLTLIARTDDGVRVWLNGQVVIDQWVLRSAADSTYTFSAEAGQRYRIRMEYFEHTGAAVARLWWQSANEPKGPIPTSQLHPTDPVDPPNGTGTGLLASYFANETLSGAPVLGRTEARVDHNWAGGSPGAGVPVDVFSARWLGEIEPRTSEPLTIIARTDDGVRLWIDGQLVIDQWILRGAADSTYTFSAEAGRRYTIRMEYFERYGSAVAKLWWQSASEPKAPIPTSQLYPTEPAIPPAGTGTGLFATYFANETLSGEPILSRVEARIDHNWSGGSPGSPVPVDVFSARWEGEIEPRVSEPLTIIARTDDGVRVWLDDAPVIDAWILRGAADSTYTFTAVAGQRYRIRMEYFEHFGSAVAKLWWQSANEPKGPIPTSQLYPITGTPTTPTIAFVTTGTIVAEDAGSTSVAVALSQAATTDVTVALQSSGATAPATVLIPAGSTTVAVPVTISDDPRFGPDRQVTLSLAAPIGANLGLATSHILTLLNTDPAPTIAFTEATSFNLEQSGTASVIVRLSAVSAQTTTVTVGVSGTATPGSDFVAPPATLQIPADTFEGVIFIPLLADSIPEQDETIILTLSDPVGATLGSLVTHTITLSDGNLPPVIVDGPTPAMNPVTGTTVELGLIVSDDGPAADLTTTWSVVGAPAGSVTFAPASSTGFAVSTTATLNGAFGTYTIQATSRDAYNASVSAQVILTFVASKQPQTITFTPPPAKTYGDAPFTLSATASSGLPVTLTSDDPSVATVSGTTVTIVGAGSTTITATQNGNATWEAATPVSHPLTVAKAAQTITFAALGSRVVGDAPFELTATASSAQPVSYTTSDPSVATLSGSTVTILAAGSTTITASQNGSANHLAAAPVDQVLTVTKQTQTITFAALPATTYGDAPLTLTATASSGLPVSFVSADNAIATVSGNTVTIVGAGSTTITATQVGDATWDPATEVAQTLTVAKATQVISFAPFGLHTVDEAPFLLTATASSGEPVSYVSSDPTVATVTDGTVTILAVGSTTITASQDGTANHLAAAPVPQVLTVTKKAQVITFDTLAAKTYGDAPFTLIGTASSGLPLTFSSADSAVATVSGTTVTIVGAGSTTITAEQAGDATWDAATSVAQPLTVAKASQTITFDALPSKTVTDAPFTLQATSSSGLAVTFASPDTSVVTISGSLATIVGPGTATITASQSGDGNYAAASPVPRTLTVSGTTEPPEPTINWETDLSVTATITDYKTGSDNETIEGVEYHYTNSEDPIGVSVNATSASGATIVSVAITFGDTTKIITSGSGSETFAFPAEGQYDVAVQVTATKGDQTGSRYVDKFKDSDNNEATKRLAVDRTDPSLVMLLPKRFQPNDGDRTYQAGQTEYPLVTRSDGKFVINMMTDAWNKPLRTRYDHPFYGKDDLTAGLIAAIIDDVGLDQNHPADAATITAIDVRGMEVALTSAAVLDKTSSNADKPEETTASTKQRLLITGWSGLNESYPKNSVVPAAGVYRVRFKLTDKAGNESEALEPIKVMVDRIAPEVENDSDYPGGSLPIGGFATSLPFRFASPSADEEIMLAWQVSGTPSTSTGAPPTDDPLRSYPFGFRLNETFDGTRYDIAADTDVGTPPAYYWIQNRYFLFADAGGNPRSGQAQQYKFVCFTVGDPLFYESGTLYHLIPNVVYGRDQSPSTLYFYDWAGRDYQTYYDPDNEDDDTRPNQKSTFGTSQLFSLNRNGADDYTDLEKRASNPEPQPYQAPDRYSVAQESPLDPQQTPSGQDLLWIKPAIITVAPSWKSQASGATAPTQEIIIVDKPELLEPGAGNITLANSTEPVAQDDAQPVESEGKKGLKVTRSLDRQYWKPGFSPLNYAYGVPSNSGEGDYSSSNLAQAFYQEGGDATASLSSFGGGLHYEYVVGIPYWANVIKATPDVIATGSTVTLVIEAGFFTDLHQTNTFSATGDYVHFLLPGEGDDVTDVTTPPANVASLTPEQARSRIAILSQRLIYPEDNIWSGQKLELTLAVGQDISPALYHIDVKFGAVKGYSDELSQQSKGENGAHRMKEALAAFKPELVDQDDTAYPLIAPISDPHPVITLNSVTVSPREDATADVVITGTVEDAVADFAAGSRPTEVRFLEYTAPITADGAPESDPIWKPRAWRGRFELQFNRLLMQDDIIGNVTAVNALGNEGSARVVINAKFRIEGPDHGVPATSYDDIRAPVATLQAQPKAGAISTLSLSLDKVTYVTMSEEAAGSGVLTGVLPDETMWRWTVAELMVPETIAADTLLPVPAKLSGELVIQQPASAPVALQLDLTLLSGLNYATIVHVVGGDEEAGNTARVILEAANGTLGKSSKSGLVKPLRLRRQMPTEMTIPSQEFHFAGMPFRWQSDPSDPTVWLSDKAVLLTQLSGANEPQVVDVTKPADLRVVADDKTAAEMYASLIMSDDPHDTITVGTGLTVKVRAVVAGWIPTEAEQALTTGTWKLKAHAGTSGADIPLNDVEEDRSERRDGRTWLGFGRIERKTVYTFKASIPKSQPVGTYDLVWTDASGKEHPPLEEQVRVIHPMVIMLCIDGINGDLFQEALRDAKDGSGLDLVFGQAKSRVSGSRLFPPRDMPNNQFFSPSETYTAINSLPTITWCNWATIFTGKEPKDHGILGNSFFRREVNGSRPLFSGNAESAYDSQADHRNAAVHGLSPLLYPGTDTIFQNFTAMDANREAVSIHAWYPNAKSGTEFNGTQQGEYGQVNVGADNLRCVRYLLPGWAGWSAFKGEVIPSLQALHHNEEGAKEADQISGERALELLTDASNLPSLLAIYFPGPDNIGHAKGRESDANGDGTKSLAITKEFLMNEVDGTDAQLKLLHKRVKKLGAQNAVIWLAVSDHGLMGTNRDLHPHPRPTTPPPLTGAYKDSDNPLSGGLFSLRDGERYLYGSGKLNGLKTQYRSEMEVFFRRVLEQNPDDFPQDQTTNTVWYDRPIPRGDGTFIPALEALWAPQLPVPVSAIYSPDGGLAHIYVRERTGDSNWNQVSGGVAGNDTRQLAWYLAKESLGDFSQFPGGKPLMPKDESNPALGSQFQDALAFKDGTATVAGVFVLVGTKYQRAVPLDGLGEVNLIDIDDSMTGGASWKILKTRLDEMARQTGVSRSGDIVLIFNIRGSYATVNDATEEELNGWHGSPTQAESVTPLVYATPGYGWYQSDNSSLPTSAQSTSSSEGKYRNSDVRGSLEALIKSVTGR